MQTKTTHRADLLAEAARRLRRHYGDELERLYALAHAPYEPDEAVHLVAVLSNFEPFAEGLEPAGVIGTLARDYNTSFVVHEAPTEGDELTARAQSEGVPL